MEKKSLLVSSFDKNSPVVSSGGYDTLHIWTSDIPGDVSALVNRKEKPSEYGDGTYTTGMLGNLHIAYSERGTSIKGSISEFYHGSNCYNLTLSQTPQAFNQIEASLSIPLGESAYVNRLDFGQNFIVEYPPSAFFPYLGDAPHFDRFIQPRSLYYQNGKRQFILYDKKAEAKTRKKEMPELWDSAYVLKAELRYLKQPHKQLNQSKISVSTLCQPAFIRLMQERFVSTYQSIQKVADFNYNYEAIKTPGDAIDQFMAARLINPGWDEAMNYIDQLKARKVFANPSNYTRLLDQFVSLNSMQCTSTTSPLIDDLTKQFEDILIVR